MPENREDFDTKDSFIRVRATSLCVFGFSRRLSLSQCPYRKFLEMVLIRFKTFVNIRVQKMHLMEFGQHLRCSSIGQQLQLFSFTFYNHKRLLKRIFLAPSLILTFIVIKGVYRKSTRHKCSSLATMIMGCQR